MVTPETGEVGLQGTITKREGTDDVPGQAG